MDYYNELREIIEFIEKHAENPLQEKQLLHKLKDVFGYCWLEVVDE